MTSARKLAATALLLAATGYYASTTALAWSTCEQWREECYSEGGTFYTWGNCDIHDGVTCGDFSCGSGGSYGTKSPCCWGFQVGCGS